jgi:hypothetical protein
MSRLLIVSILATSTAPRYAQGAQPDVVQLTTVQEKDRKKAEELGRASLSTNRWSENPGAGHRLTTEWLIFLYFRRRRID